MGGRMREYERPRLLDVERTLMPCPFCGSSETRINWMPENTYIFCLDCYARGPRVFRSKRTEEAKQRATERWNERDEPRLF